MKIRTPKKFKKTKGFTLVELLLSIGFIGVASAVVYGVYSKAEDMAKIDTELRTIATFMEKVEAIADSRGSFTGINTSTLEGFGLSFVSELKNAEISTPNPQTIDIKYSEVNERVCSGLAVQSEGKLGTNSLVKIKANGQELKSPISPVEAAANCKKNRSSNEIVVSLSKLDAQVNAINGVPQSVRPQKQEPIYPTFGVNVMPPTFAIPEAPVFLVAQQPSSGVYVPPPAPTTPPIPELIPGSGSSTPPGQSGGIDDTIPPGEGGIQPPVGGSGGGNFQVPEGIPDGYLEITEVCMQTKYVIHQTTAAYEELVVVEGPSPTLCTPFDEAATQGIQQSFLLDWVDAYIAEEGGNGYYTPSFYTSNGTTERFENAYSYLTPYITLLQLQGAQLPPGQRFNSVIPSCTKYNYFLNQTGPRVYFPESGSAGLTSKDYPPTVISENDWQNASKGNNTLVLYVDKEKESDCK